MFKIIVGVVIASLVLIIVLSNVDRYNRNIVNGVQTQEVVDSNKVNATITGEVSRTGTYVVNIGVSLAELVSAANGLTSNADDLAFDLDYIIDSDLSFYIAPKYDHSNVCSSDPIKKVNINVDDKATLMSINAIGDTIATKIIEYRQSKPFYRLEDVKNVTGVGNATFEKIKNYITIR